MQVRKLHNAENPNAVQCETVAGRVETADAGTVTGPRGATALSGGAGASVRLGQEFLPSPTRWPCPLWRPKLFQFGAKKHNVSPLSGNI